MNFVPISYYISNPTTNQLFTLPSVSTSYFDTIRFSLAFDPSHTSNYKVICARSTLSKVFHHQILNGSIHLDSPPTNIETLRFDVCRECIGQFPDLPFRDGRGRRRSRYFGVSGGHFHLIEVYQPRSAQFKVYEIILIGVLDTMWIWSLL
ncbi:hypothetical protein M5689_017433 [Euphorbia peplus]|nr:hypothetical protein M5689_017433 [Euphorbia peplus]